MTCLGSLVLAKQVVFYIYADDLVIFSSCTVAVQQLFSIRSQCGADFDISFNAKKSHLIISR